MKLTRLSTLHFIASMIHFYKKQVVSSGFSVYMIKLFSSEYMWHLPSNQRHGESSIKFISR